MAKNLENHIIKKHRHLIKPVGVTVAVLAVMITECTKYKRNWIA